MAATETIIVKNTAKISLPPIKTILALTTAFLLTIALLTGATYRFYASFLFLFYSLTRSMWISVVLLGIFQTVLMIPFRIVSLRQAMHIKEFEEKLDKIDRKTQRFIFKKGILRGDATFLWSLINFFIQTISYFSIGRLFLTDFYTVSLNPKLLYSFVPYPKYPILDTFFKIPYPIFSRTINLGMEKFWLFVIAIVSYKLLVAKFISFYRRRKADFKLTDSQTPALAVIKKTVKFTSGSTILLIFLAWLLISHFPVGWQIKIFTGDISRPNIPLNTTTAIITFLIILWLDLPKIIKKTALARQQNIDKRTVNKTQIKLFKASFKKATVLGLGAYFITNMIPSAFELSIFTLEMISFLSPFTLDKLIFKIGQGIKIKKAES